MMTNEQLLVIAKKHLGQGGARFRKYAGLPAGAAWCNAFVDYVANEGGVKSLYFNGKKETYCPHSIKWCEKNLAQVPLYLAFPMDIIYFDWDKNGNPNHIGFVRGRKSTSSINTIEGNTGNAVRQKTRPAKYVQAVFRPHFLPPARLTKLRLGENDKFGWFSIYNLQVALGMKPTGILTKETVKYWQRKIGATPDGAWGPATSEKAQTFLKKKGFYKGEVDREFGSASVVAMKNWINSVNYPKKTTTKKDTAKKTADTAKKTTTSTKAPATTKKPATTAKKPTATAKKQTNAEKLLATMKKLAWPYGTAKKKYAFKTGAPTTACKEAMKKYGWADDRAEMSDCGNFVSTVVRESGVEKSFKALHGVKTPFPTKETKFSIVHKGKKIPKGFLKAGDIIRYKKKNGKQHAMFYFGDGKICEASHHSRFGVILKDNGKYNKVSKVKTIQVLRAKEK